MRRRGRFIAVAAGCAALASLGAAGVQAGTRATKDRITLKAAPHGQDRNVERRIDDLIRRMTLDEKLNQLTLLSDGQINDAEAAKPVGGVFSLTDPAKIDHYQRIAVQQSRLHIPILFAYDTIHGFRTIFPIPLATA